VVDVELEVPKTAIYIGHMSRNPRGQPVNAPPDFIHPCRPIVAKRPPVGPGWVHELKHDGYRLQIHVRDGRVQLFTMNGHNWTDRYPRIIEEAGRIKGAAILDAEVVCLDEKGLPEFDALHSRTANQFAVACAFDLLALNGDDLRKRPLVERKSALAKLLIRSRGGIQYVEHAEGHGEKMYEAVCALGLEGIVSKRRGSFYRSGPSKMWIKVKNPKAPAATRVLEGGF
jgi:bifunctional non-homologous end joining protein LigD